MSAIPELLVQTKRERRPVQSERRQKFPGLSLESAVFFLGVLLVDSVLHVWDLPFLHAAPFGFLTLLSLAALRGCQSWGPGDSVRMQDLEKIFSLPVLGVIPRVDDGSPALEGRSEIDVRRYLEPVARRLDTLRSAEGCRVLVVSLHSGEGKSVTATNLSAACGRRGASVLLVDAHARPAEAPLGLRPFAPNRSVDFDGSRLIERIGRKRLERLQAELKVDSFPLVSEFTLRDSSDPSRRCNQLQDLSELYSLVLVDSPPLLLYADTWEWANSADVILFVVQSGTLSRRQTEKAIERLKTIDKPLLGLIVNDADPGEAAAFLRSEAIV